MWQTGSAVGSGRESGFAVDGPIPFLRGRSLALLIDVCSDGVTGCNLPPGDV